MDRSGKRPHEEFAVDALTRAGHQITGRHDGAALVARTVWNARAVGDDAVLQMRVCADRHIIPYHAADEHRRIRDARPRAGESGPFHSS